MVRVGGGITFVSKVCALPLSIFWGMSSVNSISPRTCMRTRVLEFPQNGAVIFFLERKWGLVLKIRFEINQNSQFVLLNK